MELNNESIESIRKRIDETEKNIDKLNAELNGMEEEKNSLENAYNAAKEDYENYRGVYAEKSTAGLYFFIVAAIVFAVILIQVLSHNMVKFFLYPAAVIFIIAAVLKLIHGRRFHALTPVMKKKAEDYEAAKEAYEKFMQVYTGTASELEKNQYQWELDENDMIEARKDAWVAQQKTVAAE